MSAIEIIKRLSVERFLCIRSFISNPNRPPKTNTPRFFMIGIIMFKKLNASPVIEVTATEIAIL